MRDDSQTKSEEMQHKISEIEEQLSECSSAVSRAAAIAAAGVDSQLARAFSKSKLHLEKFLSVFSIASPV